MWIIFKIIYYFIVKTIRKLAIKHSKFKPYGVHNQRHPGFMTSQILANAWQNFISLSISVIWPTCMITKLPSNFQRLSSVTWLILTENSKLYFITMTQYSGPWYCKISFLSSIGMMNPLSPPSSKEKCIKSISLPLKFSNTWLKPTSTLNVTSILLSF